MRGIQLAQHLTQHIPEVVFVVDIWQEPTIVLAIALPIHVVQILYIELILHLAPDMVEQVGALLIGTIVEHRLEINVLSGFLAQLQLFDTTACGQKQVVVFLISIHPSASHALHQQLGLIFSDIVHPQVVATFV